MKKGKSQKSLGNDLSPHGFSKPSETRGRTHRLPAGRLPNRQDGQNLSGDDDFCQRDNKNISRTTIFPSRTAKNLAGRMAACVWRLRLYC